MAASDSSHPERTMRIDIAPSELDTGTQEKKPAFRMNRGTWKARAAERSTPFFKLLESIYDAVLITDQTGVILECNQRASDYFLLASTSIIGQSVVTLISGATTSLLETIHTNLADQKYTLVEARCKRADETSFAAEIAINKIELDAKGQLCFLIRDVTMRHNAVHALEDAVERLQAHDRARMEFVSNVSHELRTPLTSMIYAVTNMLRGVVGPMPEKAVLYLDRLLADSQRLLATVNDILDLRQIENKNLILTRKLVPLGPVITDGADPLHIQADSKHIQIIFDFLDRELFCLCDAQKIERMVLNLVGNAVKFTPANGTIRLTLRPSEDHPDKALLSVCDTGAGVPPDMLPKLSQRYFRAGEHVSGTGLGLAISREIVELHGGSMTFASPVPGTECGTAVYVELPLASKPLVMAFSQDPETAEFLTRQITAKGYAIQCVGSSSELLDACIRKPPSVLVTDTRNTDMDVRDLVMQLREQTACKQLPIIVIGLQRQPRSDIEFYRHLGIFYACLPWTPDELARTLSMAMRGKLR